MHAYYHTTYHRACQGTICNICEDLFASPVISAETAMKEVGKRTRTIGKIGKYPCIRLDC